MDSFFGIGIAELFFIAILALIILGPERLPGAIREVVKVIRYIRNLTNELTSQFGDEMKAFDDLNPQKILNEMIEDPDEKKAAADKAKAAAKTTAKPAAKPAPKTTAATAKPATAKPATAKPATAKPATAKPATPKPVTAKPATDTSAGEKTELAETPKRAEPPTIKGTLLPGATATSGKSDDHADQTAAPAKTDGAAASEPRPEGARLPPSAASVAPAADSAKSGDDSGDDKVVEKPARPTTVAVNGTAASVDGSEA